MKGSSSDCEKEDLIQELDVMRKIPKHKNIVSYLGCCTKQGIYCRKKEHLYNFL